MLRRSLLTFLFLQAIRPEIISLEGTWTLSNASTRISTYIATGSDVYSILASVGFYSDPLVGFNDVAQRLISYQNWNFTHLFHVSRPSGSQWAILILDELDTYCCVWLNGYLLRCTTNSFHRHQLNISPYLRLGAWNKLELAFESTPRMAKSLAQQLVRQSLYVPPPSCWPDNYHGECHVNLVRTTQASFGWDWGPAFPIQGFWRIPQIGFFQVGARLGEGLKFYPSLLHSKMQGNLWTADVLVEVLVQASSPILCLEVQLADLMHLPKRNCFLSGWQGMDNLSMDIPVRLFNRCPNVREWWPNGIESGPYVYNLHVKLTTAHGLLLDRASYRVGFREVELVEQPIQISSNGSLQDFGSTFFFKVNGLPVFAKGSNWIPQRLLPGKHPGLYRVRPNSSSPVQDMETGPMEEVLRSAAMVGTNMLRVWGGGRYESRHFYDLASRLGIMIWQDMMFACATYTPETGTGEDTIRIEIRRQIRRLHHHPSIVVWAANNEVELAIAGEWYPYSPELRKQYKAVFLDRVSATVRSEEAKPPWPWVSSESYAPRKCLLSSPSNGQRSERRGGVDTNPQDPLIGDVHFYRYEGDLWNEGVYPLTRFTSEFGVQSLPSPLGWLRSLEGSGSPDDWSLNGRLMQHRQHSPVGMAGMLGPSLQMGLRDTTKPSTGIQNPHQLP
uniref:Beta-mannosidase n=1 Tax=Schistocephalus solidus TaxID=70667 RepID=A0A0X3PRU0_SCHSO